MSNVLKVKNKAILDILPNHTDGEIAYCEEEKQYMMYKDGWNPVEGKVEGSGLEMNLYDLNKSIISQLKPLNERKLRGCEKSLNEWSYKSSYYLLYGKEMGYFTLLTENEYPLEADYKNFGEGIISLLKDISKEIIYSIDIKNEDTIEIWIDYNNTPTVLYLMDWKDGLVSYGK